jgi:hypothetical protein
MSKLGDALKTMVGAGKPSPFVHVERELAELLGVAQDTVKEQRQTLQLTRGADWELVKGSVTYTDPSAKKILVALQRPPEAPAATVTPPAAAPPGDSAPNTAPAIPAVAELPSRAPVAIVDLVCVKQPRNPHIVLARLAAADRSAPLVRVRIRNVRNADLFKPGTEIKARHVQDDLYQLEGRAPRADTTAT